MCLCICMQCRMLVQGVPLLLQCRMLWMQVFIGITAWSHPVRLSISKDLLQQICKLVLCITGMLTDRALQARHALALHTSIPVATCLLYMRVYSYRWQVKHTRACESRRYKPLSQSSCAAPATSGHAHAGWKPVET